MPPDTQTDRTRDAPVHTGRSPGTFFARPLFLALVVTLANAAKPVAIDDAAYLAYARQIAAKPADPYGFDLYWYTVPYPAFEILAPPVLPYWLGLSVALFGVVPVLLKLWLFPFVWLFASAVRELLRRFARGTESRLVPLVVLSPAVLPTVNLMLDVPALALGLAAVVVFVRAADAGSWRLAVAAGLVAAAAMQTKYTMLLIPPAVVWYGITHRRFRLAACTAAVATVASAGWELMMAAKYGDSHFLHHAAAQKAAAKPGEGKLAAFVREKSVLAAPLAGFLGCLGVGVGLVAGAALGLPRRALAAAAAAWGTGFLLVVFVPYSRTVIEYSNPPGVADRTAVMVFWQTAGVLVLATVAGCAVLQTLRFGKGLRVRANAASAFLAGWFLLEVAGYFALTPFGAARRVIGLVVVSALVVGRALSRVERTRAGRRPPRWAIGFGIAVGVVVTALDTFDAFPEKVCAERAAVLAANRAPGSTAWYAGHWGFQFYCERAGMVPVVPGECVLSPGDVLVLPAYPDEFGFYRPHIGNVPIRPPAWAAEPIAEVVWDDRLSGQTVPNFYCGVDPVAGRDAPRLRVVVYRVVAAWKVPGQ